MTRIFGFFKTLSSSIFVLLYLFTTLFFIFVAYPISYNEATNFDFENTNYEILDSAKTKGSVFYLVSDESETYMIQLEKLTFAPRFRINPPYKLSENEEFGGRNYFEKYNIILSNQKIQLEHTPYLSPQRFLWEFIGIIVFVLFIKELYSYRKQKKLNLQKMQ